MSVNSLDGRHARTGRSRDTVVDAVLTYIRDNGAFPTGEDIARISGVSRRTVFRLFDDLESLHIAVNQAVEAQVRAAHPPPMPQKESCAATIDRVVAHRVAVYALIQPMRDIGEVMRDDHPFAAETLDEASAQLRTHLRLMFNAHIANNDNVTWQAAELITSWYAWRTLVGVQGCSHKVAQRVMRESLTRLLDV